jgi:hypothetical protein
MTRLARGFKLFQPWANEIVQGKMKFLIRSIPTNFRERVAIIATEGLDGFWVLNTEDEEIERISKRVGAIGSVEIKDCVSVEAKKIKEYILKTAGKKYWEYYPKYLISDDKDMLYVWFLDNVKEWKNSKEVNGWGITWSKINMNDE